MEASAYIGRVIGSWRLVRLLGEGAFGGVFAGEHVSIAGRQAAVKILRPELSVQPGIKQRFLNEATAASRAEHENIVQVFDCGDTPDGLCYLVMELVRGVTLTQHLRNSRLPADRTTNIAVQIAGALHAAHSCQVVHRDLKPDNIFITERPHNSEFVKVLDFGVAKLRGEGDDKLTATGMIIGTAAYMAPEQWMGRTDVDGRADIYALGVILYECLAGARPFNASNHFEWMKLHMDAVPPLGLERYGISPALSRLVLHMLARRPEDRPQTMGQVVRELQAIAQGAAAPTQVAAGPASYPSAPAYGAVPSHPSAPAYGAVPSPPSAPAYGAVPSHPSAPAYGAVPSYPSAPAYPAQPPREPLVSRRALVWLGQFALGAVAIVIYVLMNWKEAQGWLQSIKSTLGLGT